ncbi:MAG: amidase, partial [Pricia sp.]|nr:amidase [Pricia sp.]
MAKKILLSIVIAFILFSCKDEKKEITEEGILWEPYNDSAEIAANQDNEIERMRYKLIQSKVLDKNDVFRPLYSEVRQLTDAEYNGLKPYILEQDIPT